MTFNFSFDASNPNWTPDSTNNIMFLAAVRRHMNNLRTVRGHVFLNEALDTLKIPRVLEGQTHGWGPEDDIDFGVSQQSWPDDGDAFMLKLNAQLCPDDILPRYEEIV